MNARKLYEAKRIVANSHHDAAVRALEAKYKASFAALKRQYEKDLAALNALYEVQDKADKLPTGSRHRGMKGVEK